MSDFSVFSGVENAKSIGGFTGRLGIGEHTLTLTRFAVKESQKDKTKILEADFRVVDSTSHNPRESRGWAWFIQAKGFAGSYEEARAKAFLEAVAKCIGDTSGIAAIGSALAGPAQPGRGLKIRCVVSPQTNRDGSPKLSPKGDVYTNIEWLPVIQTLDDIQAARAELDSGAASSPVEDAPAGLLSALAKR